MPKIRRVIKKEKTSPIQQDLRIDETPRWSNNLRRSSSPLNKSKEQARPPTPTLGDLYEGKPLSPDLSRISEDRAISPKPEETYLDKPLISNPNLSRMSDDRSASPKHEESFLERPNTSNLNISEFSDDRTLSLRPEGTEKPTKSHAVLSKLIDEKNLSDKTEPTHPNALEIPKLDQAAQTDGEVQVKKEDSAVYEQSPVSEESRQKILDLEAQLQSSEQASQNLYNQLQFSNKEYLSVRDTMLII